MHYRRWQQTTAVTTDHRGDAVVTKTVTALIITLSLYRKRAFTLLKNIFTDSLEFNHSQKLPLKSLKLFTLWNEYEWMNEWMNEWGIYIALYCVLLYTQSALQSYEGVSLQPPPVCSIHLDDMDPLGISFLQIRTQICTLLFLTREFARKRYSVSEPVEKTPAF